ncbi:MAG: MazG-like family protein [Candidatus Altiarchaeota archaeon]
MAALMDLQRQVRDLDEEKGWIDKPYQTLMHIQEELGELSNQMLLEDGYKSDEEFSPARVAEELTDILYLTLKMANHYDLSMDDEWVRMKSRYVRK